MPILKNPKYEKFAQEVAKGKGIEEAYRLAGYEKPHRQNAHRLMTNDDIKARVAEIQGRAAEKAVVTVTMITERLLDIAENCDGLGRDEGNVKAFGVARQAYVDVAKLNGLIIDRQDHTSSDGSMTPPTRIELVPLKGNGDGTN